MDKNIKGLCLQDLHFGIKDSARLYEELDQALDLIEDSGIRVLVITGDYFDRKLSLGDPATILAISFFNRLMDMAQRFLTVRIIQGTRSHDLNQLQVLKEAIPTDADCEIITTASTEDLFGMRVLYLPEEYPENSKEYYEPFMGKDKYDVIFGHGTWDFVAFENQKQHANDNSMLSAPVFFYEDWKDTLESAVAIFGHIHSRHTYKKKIFYSGSFTRWGYGEKSERGCTLFEFNPNAKENKVSVEFWTNEKAPTFDTIILASMFDKETIEGLKLDELEIILDNAIKTSDNLKIDLSGLPADKVEYFKNKYKDMKNVKIEIKLKPVFLKEEASDDNDDSSYNKYKYITDRELSVDQTIVKFAKDEFDKDIKIDTVRKIIE